MSQHDPKKPDPIKAINSVFELAFGDRNEVASQSPGEVATALKSLGADSERGWQSMQATLRTAQGKARLGAARRDRLRAHDVAEKPAQATVSVQALIDEIKGLLSMSGGQVAVFARKAESMPLGDLESLRDQLIRTAARAAKKSPDAG